MNKDQRYNKGTNCQFNGRKEDCKNRKNLDKITQPVLILQATNDTTVFSISAEIINKNLGSTNKTLIWYNETKHVLTKSSIKENVFNDVLAFLHSN